MKHLNILKYRQEFTKDNKLGRDLQQNLKLRRLNQFYLQENPFSPVRPP
jgi:hypothetical protein